MKFNWKRLLGRGPERIDPRRVLIKEVPLQELGIALGYVLVAGFWILFSDEILYVVLGSPHDSPALQSVKGINFVTTTGLLLYLVLRRSFRNRRLAEEALRLSQERFEGVVLATTDAIWDWNLDTNVVWWSDGVQKLFGYRMEDVSSRVDWWLERLHPEDKERVTKAIRAVVDQGGRTWAGHYRFKRADGSYAVVLDRGYVIQDTTGKPVRLVGGVADISERRKAEEALENSRAQLRALAARLQSARESERTMVAREIHDQFGQVLTALKMNLDWMEQRMEKIEGNAEMNRLLERVVESGEIVDSAIRSVQRIATDLRPPVLDNLGLAEALREEAARFQQRSGVTVSLNLSGEIGEVPPELATAVFRIFQEALTNVSRHAKATTVTASLLSHEGRLVLDVVDDGQGIEPDALSNPNSLGLVGMRERAWGFGGEVGVSPAERQGTRVSLRLPLPAKKPATN